jgi:PAS domain S-box-containing protein
MNIEVGYGLGRGTVAFDTGAAAAQQAMTSISKYSLSAVLVFASVQYDLEELLRGIHSVVGDVPVLGTTTAGEICNDSLQNSVVVATLASPYLNVRVGVGKGVSKNWQQAVTQAASSPEIQPFFSLPSQEEVQEPWIFGNSVWPELTRQGKAAFALLFSPGNTRQSDSRSYEILEELKRLSGGSLPIFGGSSADDWRMEGNYVLLGQQAYPDSVLVAVFETQLRFGIGLAHGFRPGTRRATITRVRGHEVLELDGKPAAETYAQMLGTSREALAGKHLTLTTGQPAGTPDIYGQYSINVASYFTSQEGVRFSQPVLEGSVLAIMEADKDTMIAAGQEALRKALLRGSVTDPAMAFVFSCALRTRILRERTAEEIAGMKEMLPDMPLVGFYSFGEQGLADDGVNRHNNEVITVLVLGQELSYAAQVTLENERLREDLRQSEERFRSLMETSPAGIVMVDPEGQINFANIQAEKALGLSRDEITARSYNAPAWRITDYDGNPFPDQELPFRRVMASGRPVYDVRHAIEHPDGQRVLLSINAAPLFDESGRMDGIVATVEDVTQRVQTEEEIHQRTAQLEGLGEVGLELTAQLDLDALLHSVVLRAAELAGGTEGGLFLHRPDRDVLEWAVAATLDMPTLGSVLHRGEGLAGKVWETGKPLIVDDYRHWKGRAAIYSEYRFAAIVGVPVRWGQEFLGVLDVFSETPGAFSAAHADLLSMFATQAAIAIRNAHLLQAEREQRQLAEALEETAAAVTSTLDLDRVLDRILEQVERVVAGDAFNVMLVEDDLARSVRWRGYESLGIEDYMATASLVIAEYPNIVRMVESGEPIVVPDIMNDPSWFRTEFQNWMRSYVGAPIRVGGVTVGFLNVDGTRAGQFGPADARRLAAFASQAAIAIENAQLYQRLQDYTGRLEQRVQERTAELQAQYARLDAILRSTSDGVVVTDRQGNVIQANPVAQAWLTQTLLPADAERLLDAIRDLAQRATEEPEAILELAGLDLELRAALVAEDGVKEPSAVVVDIHDVSHLKELDRVKTSLVTNISHELRTPVTTVQSYAYLMQRTSPQDEKWSPYLDALVQATDRQTQLVEDIGQISRIYTGQLAMKPQLTYVDELCESIVATHQTLAQRQGVTLEHHTENGDLGRDLVSSVDPKQFAQALSYLVSDAIRYTPEGGHIAVSTSQQEAEGHIWTSVAVSDTGERIPKEDLPYIFGRFFREEEPRSERASETGLRLMIVREIVRLHHGRLTVKSEESLGTTFTIWLPPIEKEST